ncbi:hypothetical protein ORIO_03875 [Cereibacter azotoformans]|uniref:Spx/MgsR family transcriptional regulator n=2 Tax=Cereibacter TaxID=1653176 RepID=A0A2T5JWJ9_9RHOB|nr:ArsC/Spx/MgsR family protein [Cereibacter azotoformans]AXQ92969.1 hypothetical protein D0Z66_03520 [Cereibacter sphaeroides]MBO4169351.1 hypothetical protein [Cereibacter azotoformans]PTR14549.1 Spx/MgsR family transcriptional regulator [Cereibacter azotoformans]UIJ31262.1 hypothetical protein LV780_03530 [Cereibacter azotoformans]ULB09069.1 hypothetical protein ORIO_03875 [Cereibacter azotoformans]
MILYGISTCDTCKKALKALEAAGHSIEFRDVRARPLSESEISELVTEFGDAIVNRQSTTWRGLSDWLKASEPEAQIAAQPTLMKRPVIRTEEGLFLGWDSGVQRRLLG